MQKYRKLKKSILKEGAIALAIIAVLAGITYFVTGEIESEEREQRQLKGNIRSLANQIDELERKHGIVNSSITEFRRLKGRQERGAFSINREQARDIFDTLRKKYRISNLSMTVTPKDAMSGKDIERPTAQITFSEAILEFDAMSDLHVFSFINDAQQTLPGFLKITDFNINRQRKITNEVYVSVSRGEEPRMVSARVNFLWLGIEDKPKVVNEAQ